MTVLRQLRESIKNEEHNKTINRQLNTIKRIEINFRRSKNQKLQKTIKRLERKWNIKTRTYTENQKKIKNNQRTI